MVIYSVHWKLSEDSRPIVPTKQRNKLRDHMWSISVLCRNSKDAIACASFHFQKTDHFQVFSFDDGDLSIKRERVDSRGFNPKYLFCDGIDQPLDLQDLHGSLLKYSRRFIVIDYAYIHP